MANKRIPSNVLVTPLVLDELFKVAVGHIQEKEDKKEEPRQVTKASVLFGLGIVENEKGIFVLDRDGCSETDPITDENPYVIRLYGEYKSKKGDDNSVGVDIFPVVAYSLKPEHLKELATGTPEPLETFIRRFGNRIEANYEIQRKFFNGQPVGC